MIGSQYNGLKNHEKAELTCYLKFGSKYWKKLQEMLRGGAVLRTRSGWGWGGAELGTADFIINLEYN